MCLSNGEVISKVYMSELNSYLSRTIGHRFWRTARSVQTNDVTSDPGPRGLLVWMYGLIENGLLFSQPIYHFNWSYGCFKLTIVFFQKTRYFYRLSLFPTFFTTSHSKKLKCTWASGAVPDPYMIALNSRCWAK